uniref:Reverse transcriptase Ty1/copia-type domain-containing protein n=1 Tax=Cannabis sativa TaxID=3483 RepID=A0A803QR25_CANSA
MEELKAHTMGINIKLTPQKESQFPTSRKDVSCVTKHHISNEICPELSKKPGSCFKKYGNPNLVLGENISDDGYESARAMVRHVPEIKRNLISIAMLDDGGCTVQVEGGVLKVSKGTKTFVEARTGHLEDYGRLRTFGCIAYAHIEQDKLEPRGINCVFLGYPEGVKSYKLWSIESGNHKKFFISRDVVFEEDEVCKDTLELSSNIGPKKNDSIQFEVELEKSLTPGNREMSTETATKIEFEVEEDGEENIAIKDLKLEQMDVKTAFLHGEFDEEILMKQLEGFEVEGKEDHVCLVKKSLSGLKQSPRQWYIRPTKKILEIEIYRDRKSKELVLSQAGYISKLLNIFGFQDAKPISTPLVQHFKLSNMQSPLTKDESQYMEKVPNTSWVGSIMYVMIFTRPDLCYAMSMVSRFMHNP